MIGAGVFSVFAPAAQAAGAALLIGLGIAAVVAYCNATSSAQLAATYPTSGGTYIYGRERLGARWGYVAGWGFVVGKIASCAAMALTIVAYVFPTEWQRPAAVCTVAVMTAVTCLGVTRTARVTAILVCVVLARSLASPSSPRGRGTTAHDPMGAHPRRSRLVQDRFPSPPACSSSPTRGLRPHRDARRRGAGTEAGRSREPSSSRYSSLSSFMRRSP